MLHIIIHLLRYVFKSMDGDSGSHGGVTEAQAYSIMFERKILDMGDMSRMKKDEIIEKLRKPDKIKNLHDGMQRMTWKGKRYKVEVYVDALDRYAHKTESYF